MRDRQRSHSSWDESFLPRWRLLRSKHIFIQSVSISSKERTQTGMVSWATWFEICHVLCILHQRFLLQQVKRSIKSVWEVCKLGLNALIFKFPSMIIHSTCYPSLGFWLNYMHPLFLQGVGCSPTCLNTFKALVIVSLGAATLNRRMLELQLPEYVVHNQRTGKDRGVCVLLR